MFPNVPSSLILIPVFLNLSAPSFPKPHPIKDNELRAYCAVIPGGQRAACHQILKKKIQEVKLVCLKAKILNSGHEISLLSTIPTNAKIELGLEKNKILISIFTLW